MIEDPNALLRFEFQNEYGERWSVEIDAARQSGLLRGDESAWDPIEIHNGVIAGGFGLSGEEHEWLSEVWEQATGQKLQPTWINRMEALFKIYRESISES